jgi:hypothetical protein
MNLSKASLSAASDFGRGGTVGSAGRVGGAGPVVGIAAPYAAVDGAAEGAEAVGVCGSVRRRTGRAAGCGASCVQWPACSSHPPRLSTNSSAPTGSSGCPTAGPSSGEGGSRSESSPSAAAAHDGCHSPDGHGTPTPPSSSQTSGSLTSTRSLSFDDVDVELLDAGDAEDDVDVELLDAGDAEVAMFSSMAS